MQTAELALSTSRLYTSRARLDEARTESSCGLAARCRRIANDPYYIGACITFFQVATAIAIFAFGFFPVYLSLEGDTAYRLARGAGGAITMLMPAIFTPTLRMLNTKTHALLPKSLPTRQTLSKRMSFHRYLGWAVVGAASLHVSAHAWRQSVALLSQESVTGICMLGVITVPLAGMYVARRSNLSIANWSFKKTSYYKQFLIPHQLGWWALLAAYGIHTQDLRLLTAAIGFLTLFSADRAWEWAASRTAYVQRIEKIHNSMIVVEARKPPGYTYETGQKVYVSYPPATSFINDLHPLTLASNPQERVLRFVISAGGKWSRNLIDHLKVFDKIRVSPAFPSFLESDHADSRPKLLISSGSGLAMTLAHLHGNNCWSEVNIIHITRQEAELKLLEKHINSSFIKVSVREYYDTSKGTRFSPENSELLQSFKGDVYFCGNNPLGESIKCATWKNPNIAFYQESFD